MTKRDLCKKYHLCLNPLRIAAFSLRVTTQEQKVTLAIHNGLYFQPLSSEYLSRLNAGGQ